MSDEFKIFTLNCWGIPFVSKHRHERIQAIAEFLATCQYDIVCLQEVWSLKDYELIRDKVFGVLPHSHYFYSGVAGSGICILSRHPLVEIFFYQWPLNGYIHKLHHGDWFGGKGIGLCKLRVGGMNVNVYTAHLHAEYDRDMDEYLAHRTLQAFNSAQFIKNTSGNADLVILAGDLNTEPGDLAYKLILQVAGLKDSFTESVHNFDDDGTNECPANSYTPTHSKKEESPPGKRIDHILFHPAPRTQVKVKKYTMPLPKRVPEKEFSYSDHEAISATLVLTQTEYPRSDVNKEEYKAVLNEAVSVYENSLRHISRNQLFYGSLAVGLLICLLLTIIFDVPYSFHIPYLILKLLLIVGMIYLGILSTIWNKIERHAIIAGKLEIEVLLKDLKNSKNVDDLDKSLKFG